MSRTNELNVQLFLDLSRLGVTQITLTEDACKKLMEQLKGLYVSDKPFTNPEDLDALDVGWAGELAGIRFFREIK